MNKFPRLTLDNANNLKNFRAELFFHSRLNNLHEIALFLVIR